MTIDIGATAATDRCGSSRPVPSPCDFAHATRLRFVLGCLCLAAWTFTPFAVDVPIYTTSPDSSVLHNTALTMGRYPNAIEVRFAGATGIAVRNNLLDAAIQPRDDANPDVSGHLLDAEPAWFADITAGDLHLNANATPAIDQVTRLADVPDDFDAQMRPAGGGLADIAPTSASRRMRSSPTASTDAIARTRVPLCFRLLAEGLRCFRPESNMDSGLRRNDGLGRFSQGELRCRLLSSRRVPLSFAFPRGGMAMHTTLRHPGGSRDPFSVLAGRSTWIPAFAGMTRGGGFRRIAAMRFAATLFTAVLMAAGTASAAEATPPKPKTMADVLAASKPSDWRALDPENTLYLDLPAGRVVIELAPAFAPLHAKNIRALAHEHYFDGLAILRVQDNFVTQWGDPDADKPDKAHELGSASKTLAPEFEHAIGDDLPFTVLPDGDVYAPEVGFSNGMPAARDPNSGKAWLAHCYGMVGAGRDVGEETGPGTELYVVIGHAPRQLDRNIALVGRVVQGMELLSALPRGTGPLGFYEKPEQRLPVKSVRLAADVPAAERTNLEVLRTDTPTFAALVESRRNRRDDWYKVPAGKIDVCNVPIPVRVADTAAKK